MKNIHKLNGKTLELSEDVGPRKRIKVKSVVEELNILDIDNYEREDVMWLAGKPYRFEII